MLKLYNTLTRHKQVFEPLQPPQVLVYGCGPTVYGPAHIGNWRTFIVYDLLRRSLDAQDWQTRLVVNLTDVDDKTIASSRAANQNLADFTAGQIADFQTSRAAFNIEPPTREPRATNYIEPMINLVKKLLASGVAYRAEDGIYFSIEKFARYGRLSRTVFEAETAATPISADEYDKNNRRDFALWKFWQATDGITAWDAPFGRGRPGWHLECSAMIERELGQTIDIHAGGQDLCFPHHENELAQSEMANGAPLARFWLHVAFVTMDGEKMSKSLGNIITLERLRARHFDPLAFRYFVLLTHYRHPLNFNWEGLAAAQNALRKLRQLANDWHNAAPEENSPPIPAAWQETFAEAVADDLNFPQALAELWRMAKNDRLPPAAKLVLLLEFDKILGLGLDQQLKKSTIPENVLRLVREREQARKDNRFEEADRLRAAVSELGYQIDDTANGPRLRAA